MGRNNWARIWWARRDRVNWWALSGLLIILASVVGTIWAMFAVARWIWP